MKFISLEGMMYQQNTVEKQSTNEFFGMCTTQEFEFMPLAPSFLCNAIGTLVLVQI
jgi:hypothetical protein